MVKKRKIEIIIEFQEESIKKIIALKKHYKTRSNQELITLLVNEKARQLNATGAPQNVVQ